MSGKSSLGKNLFDRILENPKLLDASTPDDVEVILQTLQGERGPESDEVYFHAYNALGLTPEDQGRYENGHSWSQRRAKEIANIHARDSSLLKAADLSKSGIIPVNFNIKKSYLNQLNWDTVSNIWYGMNNVEMPETMLAAQNADGILAKWASTGYTKPANKIEIYNFSDLCEALNQKAYGPLFKGKNRKGKWATTFPKKPKEKDRLKELVPKEDQELFVESYQAPYKKSTAEDPINGKFYDAEDGRLSKKAYSDHIMDTVEKESRLVDILFDVAYGTHMLKNT